MTTLQRTESIYSSYTSYNVVATLFKNIHRMVKASLKYFSDIKSNICIRMKRGLVSNCFAWSSGIP